MPPLPQDVRDKLYKKEKNSKPKKVVQKEPGLAAILASFATSFQMVVPFQWCALLLRLGNDKMFFRFPISEHTAQWIRAQSVHDDVAAKVVASGEPSIIKSCNIEEFEYTGRLSRGDDSFGIGSGASFATDCVMNLPLTLDSGVIFAVCQFRNKIVPGFDALAQGSPANKKSKMRFANGQRVSNFRRSDVALLGPICSHLGIEIAPHLRKFHKSLLLGDAPESRVLSLPTKSAVHVETSVDLPPAMSTELNASVAPFSPPSTSFIGDDRQLEVLPTEAAGGQEAKLKRLTGLVDIHADIFGAHNRGLAKEKERARRRQMYGNSTWRLFA